MNLPPLILASVSPRRGELLKSICLDFQIVPSEAPELDDNQLTPGELAQFNAFRKGRAVAARFPDALVLGADTVVCLDGQFFGKPQNLGEARSMLQRLQGQTHQVVTGVSLIHLRSKRQNLFAESTDVRFRPLTLGQIDRYLASMDPLDKAGAYAIQENGAWLVSQISGSYSNVVGLPLERLKVELSVWAGKM